MTNNTVSKFSVEQINDLLTTHYQLAGQLTELPGYCDQNFQFTAENGEKYIVKVAGNGESKTELDMQNAAMTHLTEFGCSVPSAVKNIHQATITDVEQEGVVYFLRVLTYLPGVFLADANHNDTPDILWNSIGTFMGTIQQRLSSFEHVGAFRYLEWDLANGLRICQAKKHLLEGEQLALVNHFLVHYQNHTLPSLGQLPVGVIHNDANDYNLLVNTTVGADRMTGLIDFGDMVHSQLINELAITAAYALMHGPQQPQAVLDRLVKLVKGFNDVRPLESQEIASLYSLIALRLCTTVCNAAKAIKENPDNDYLLISVNPAWQLLGILKKLNLSAVINALSLACANSETDDKEEIIAFRKKHLGKTLSLSYQQPLKIVQGQGAYLFDETGTPYLDMVNNVCHVGHCHPDVVAAGQAQMAKLNTNTRYLHNNIVNYAEKLLATMPDKLSVCMLVNSGSEANELAFRLARNFSHSKELLVVDGAYHGNTNACIEASPYKFDGPGGEGAPAHIHKVTLPDPYRGKYQGSDVKAGRAYANDVKDVIDSLAAQGKKPGAFICESLQGVAGQIIMPDGYLQATYEHVRAAGGVCIADEVQVGFGRVGTHMWAFETQDVVPDIVTLGKPIGNGHPMAAVITTQEIADAFVTGMEYFNTFGGNPVSCAIGSAVLDVIEKEQLRQHALETGTYFKEKLAALANDFSLIGEVRGLGLFLGVELVEDRDTKEPATDKTSWLVEFFKQHHILLSTEGPFYNILKIKPPLAFDKSDADKFIDVLIKGLTQLKNNDL